MVLKSSCRAAWIASGFWLLASACSQAEPNTATIRGEVALPAPSSLSTVSLDDVLARRRSARQFSSTPLALEQIGQLAWAAQGITDSNGHRTAPSAGALYPLELYLLTAQGVFHYVPASHKLEQLDLPDLRKELAAASLDQNIVSDAALAIVITGVVARTRAKYGDRAERFMMLEAGHAAQNVLLEAVALGLVARPVGAFEDESVREVLQLPTGTFPLYVIPVGRSP